MDFTIMWRGDPEDVCLIARGAASLAELNAMFAVAVADRRWVEGMNVLLDYTGLDMTTLSAEQMQERAGQLLGMAEAIGRQRFALVAAGPDDAETMRMIGYLLDGNVGFEASMFSSLEEARAWLRDPSKVELPHILAERQASVRAPDE